MTTIKHLLVTLFLGMFLAACEKPVQHPIVGSWEGSSDSSIGEVINFLTFKGDGTYSWKQVYAGLKEIMEKRSPDIDWSDMGVETTGKFKVLNEEVILSPQESSQHYGGEELEGGPMFPLFEEGYDYTHSYYIEDKYLIFSGASGEDIVLERQ